MGQWRSLEPTPAFAAVARAPDYGEPVRAWRLWEVDDNAGAKAAGLEDYGVPVEPLDLVRLA